MSCRRCPFDGPSSRSAAATRSSLSALSVRANTASVMPVSGTPSSSAFCAVQRPVPFCSAASRITSTSGLPVAASVFDSTRAVISIRNDSSSDSFQRSNCSRDLRHLEPRRVAQQVVALGDQLHVGVLDAVVDHLHVVTGTIGADVRAARRTVDVGGDRLEDRLDRLVVWLAVAARHDARPVRARPPRRRRRRRRGSGCPARRACRAGAGCRGSWRCRRRSGCRRGPGAGRSRRSPRRSPRRPGPCSSARAGARAPPTHSSVDS